MVRRRPLVAAVILAAASLVPAGLAATSAAAASPTTRNSCSRTVPAGHAACLAVQRTDIAPRPAHLTGPRAGVTPNATPAGLGPADILSAYKLPGGSAGAGRTVAIVDAFDDPNAESDLATYRAQFGLPACTTANGCFRKVNQNGVQGSYPAADAGWAQEISLDVDMVSAACPGCQILLVEANSASFADLGAAENRAAALTATSISNSYGGSDASDASFGAFYNHPGIAITASTGDSGYGVEYPASSHYVVAVGGTSLRRASTTARGWTESAWSGAGSGCSRYNVAVAPASANTGCARRATADVSAVADPNTGVAVYGPTGSTFASGWLVFGGTSASSPIIASVYAAAGPVGTGANANTIPYAHTSSLFDVTTGSNGRCSVKQLCTARAGWDGPTGLGTPNGLGAF